MKHLLSDEIKAEPHRSGGAVTIVAKATKGEAECVVDICSGFSRRTDDSIRAGTAVYPHKFKPSEPGYKTATWVEQYAVIGTTFGLPLYEYIAMGVSFTALTGEPIFDD